MPSDTARDGSTFAHIQNVLVGEAVTQAGFVVLVADENMRYLAASEAACDLLGYTREEILDLRVSDVVEETDAAERYRAMTADGGQRGEITLVCKNGDRIAALYEAHETRVAHMPYYYVSMLTPTGPRH